jgi:hypothetical protein
MQHATRRCEHHFVVASGYEGLSPGIEVQKHIDIKSEAELLYDKSEVRGHES